MASNLHEIFPLFPEDRVTGRFHDLAAEFLRLNLDGGLYAPVLTNLRPMLRTMNSYYTNRIEE
jgi:hypothetical protein